MTRGLALTPADPTLTSLRVLRDALPGETIRPRRGNEPRAILVRADLQNVSTPASRYVRVGITAFDANAAGDTNHEGAYALCQSAMTALCMSLDPEIIAAEPQSGPFEVTDEITKKPVYYGVVLLTVRAT